MGRKSTQVALGGLCSALCLLLLFLTGLVPFATFALPALAGMVLIAVVEENGRGTALLVYSAASLLSLFVVPDREAAVLFILFFGYYPLLRQLLHRLRFWPAMLLLKGIIFNISMLVAYWLIINLLGIPDVLEEFGSFGRYSALVLLLMGNVVFIIYDYALGNIIWAYRNWFRPRLLRKKQ